MVAEQDSNAQVLSDEGHGEVEVATVLTRVHVVSVVQLEAEEEGQVSHFYVLFADVVVQIG
jgi:hypothetical protein